MMATPPYKSYTIPRNETEKITVKITEALCAAEGLYLTTWTSAYILSGLLSKLKFDGLPFDKPQDEHTILELGAGTGLTGFCATAIWNARSLLTDLPSIVPGLQANIDLNPEIAGANGDLVSCGTLDWNQPDIFHVHNSKGPSKSFTVGEVQGFPIILTADTMYTEDHPRLISQTIAACLRRSPDARAVVVYAMRVAYLDYIREFWELMEERGLVAVDEGREEIDLTNWDDEKLHEWCVWKWKDL
ncbi:hypothetical protein B0I35DRAFT_423651 [Stachybotrys elegans]|uniref:Uncharacterized protein n=1 Tax=Stachybotrys elegans TaxID=80388 RepID=A0A8K0WTD8_9HYPO|nr:hypothetical protein B0I35DRAFT_423651 [Stachybotrys elegans]